VITEGALGLIGDAIENESLESLEEMVEAVVALCECGPEVTGRNLVSLDLIAEWGLAVHNLDATLRS